MATIAASDWAALPIAPAILGESPFWHPDEAALYWCDIYGGRIHRFDPANGAHRQWDFDQHPGSLAPLPGGDLVVAFRDGVFRFSPASGERRRLAAAPYDVKTQRFNDGKADPQGRFWVGSIDEHAPRRPEAALYRHAAGRLERVTGPCIVSNGLAFGPDGRTMYWSDTAAAKVWAFDFDGSEGSLSRQRVFAEFALKVPGQSLAEYGGRPDGAAIDIEGNYWCAMYEGARLLRFAPDGRLLQELPLPVRCPTMPCFGGPDLRTLYVTSATENRPAEELKAMPLSGCVLSVRVDVPGLPVHFART
jgi:sugar lactone lactonase YvrE